MTERMRFGPMSVTESPTDLEGFKASLAGDKPPRGLPRALQALWHERKGDWKKAHELAQAQEDSQGSWVHAYLHRVEGDLSNAGHWYGRAGKPRSSAPLEDEWEEIARALLAG
ncbi:MAG: hypothetical protein ACREGL_02480 [Alphaproteobacteria bacterium]